MEKRSQPRFAADQSVVVTVLGGEELRYTAHVRNASATGLAIEVPGAVEPGSALRIELDGSILPAEAVYCNRQSDDYLIGVELDPTLCSLASLGRHLQNAGVPAGESGSQVTYALNHRKREHGQQRQQ